MKSPPSTTTTVSMPNKYQLPYVKDLYKQASDAAAAQPTSFDGPVAALPQQGQYDAYNQMLQQTGAIGQAGQTQVNLGQQWGQDLLTGKKDMPTMAGYDFAGLDRALAAEANPIMQKYTEQLIPSFRSDALAQGAGQNSRALEVMPQQFNQQMSRELSDSFARMAMTDLESQRQAQPKYDLMQQQLAGMLPQLAQGGMAQPAMQQQILSALQGLDQQSIDAAIAKLGLNQDLAFGPLERKAGIIYGSGGGQTTSTANKTGGGIGGALQGGIGGAMGAAALGANMTNPLTMGAVALAALLGGLG